MLKDGVRREGDRRSYENVQKYELSQSWVKMPPGRSGSGSLTLAAAMSIDMFAHRFDVPIHQLPPSLSADGPKREAPPRS